MRLIVVALFTLSVYASFVALFSLIGLPTQELVLVGEAAKIPLLLGIPLLYFWYKTRLRDLLLFPRHPTMELPVGLATGIAIAAFRALGRLSAGLALFDVGFVSAMYVSTAVLFAACDAFGEEMVFRRLIQGGLEGITGKFPGLMLATLIFATVHLLSASYSAQEILLEVVPGGLLTGILFQRTGNLGASVSAHFSANVLEYLLVVPAF